MGHLDLWGDILEAATFSINNRIREATGYSAHELMYGRKARLPIEAEALGESDGVDHIISAPNEKWDEDVNKFIESSKNIMHKIHQAAEHNIRAAQKSMKTIYDKKLKKAPR